MKKLDPETIDERVERLKGYLLKLDKETLADLLIEIYEALDCLFIMGAPELLVE